MTVKITIADKLTWAKRHLAQKERYCPMWVRDGRISEGAAELELLTLRSIVEDYQRAHDRPKEPEPPPPAPQIIDRVNTSAPPQTKPAPKPVTRRKRR